MSDELNEGQLIRNVFSNQNGEKLLAMWKTIYGDRRSYNPGNTPETTAFFEGQRDFYLNLIHTLEETQ